MIFGNVMDEILFLLNYMTVKKKRKVHLSVSKIKQINKKNSKTKPCNKVPEKIRNIILSRLFGS